MVNYYNSKDVESNFNSSNEENKKVGFASTFTSLFGKIKCMALVMFVILTVSQFSSAQSTANYAFSTGVSTLNSMTGSTPVPGITVFPADDSASTVIPIGFNFIYMGTHYSHFSVNSNGQLRLHTSAGATPISGTNISSYAGSTVTFAPMAGDNETGNGMSFLVTGSAPNRSLVIEWNNFYADFVDPQTSGNMQLVLNETTGVFQYIYGNILNSSTSAVTKSIFHSSSNIANSSAFITVGATPTVNTAATAPTTNSFAASVAIANLANTFYTFTPPAPASGPTGLTFSAATASTTTLDWTAASVTTGIARYVVFNSTNGGVTYNFVANVALGTNTYNATGLTPGTTYDWKVVAVSEGVESATTTGMQTTSAAATYYWVGTSSAGTPGAFATLTNWNTAADGSGSTPTALTGTDGFIVDGDGSTTTGGNVFISLAAATSVGQLKVIGNTALTLQAASGTTARIITVTGSPGDDFVVENGSTLNLTTATPAGFAFSGTGNTGLIAGTINFANSTSNTITTTGGTGTLVTVPVTGVVNLGAAGNTLVGSAATLNFLAGSNCNSTGATTGAPPVPLATWDTNSTLTISGLTTSTTAPTNNNQSFGNIIYNCPLSTATLNFFGSNTQTVRGNLTIIAAGATGGTGIFRTTSTGTVTVNGNIVISQGRFQAATTGTVIANGNTTVGVNGILDTASSTGTFSQRGNTLTNDGVLTGTTGTLQFLNFTGSAAQTLAGSGTVLTNLATLSMQNTAGLTISHTNPVIIARANLFEGTITGSNKITFGTGLAVNCTTQIGAAGLTTPGGSFDVAPIFNLGTGTYSIIYQQESVARTSGFEIPSTRSVNNVTVNNTNGITLTGGDLTTINALTLTNGIVTTGSNTLVLGNPTTVGTLTGGSSTAYVNGAFTRSIANANTNSTYVSFPIGKSGVYTPIALAPTTTSIALFKAESFGSNAGTEDPSIIGLFTNRRFEALPVSGTFTDINVRLSDAGIVSTNIPVQAATATGAYATAFGSTATFAAGPPITITSNFPVTSANYTGFLGIANSNTCSGTPNPGATTATANGLCLGQSTTLGITTIPVGSGVTYQWQSSPDGISYTDISLANGLTLTVTPTVSTFYRCNVTCSAGPATGASIPTQITFSNNVTATTPATRCGTGTVNLTATPSSGASIKWYAAATGGSALASGTSFTTPVIAATTTFFAGAETASSGNVTIGSATTLTGATSQPSAFVNRWPSYRIQTLYTAAELNAAGLGAGNITSMSYFTTTLGDGATNSNFTVKIGTSTQNVMTTTWVPTTSFTTVYGPVIHTHTASGEQPIGFTTPFNWDGVSNIVIEVTYNGANLSNNAQTFFTATTSNMVVHSDTSGSAAISGTVSTTRLNLKINGQVACSSSREPVVATVNTPPTLTLSSATTSICSGQTSGLVTLTAGVSDYDTFVWSPSTGVSGNEVTGWVFNPTVSGTYTLTASQSTGSLCSITASFNVTVNPLPSAVTITPASSSICADAVQSLVATGGTSNVVLLNENFNSATNSFTSDNSSTGGTVVNAAWTLRNSGYSYSTFGTFNSNDVSQFYLSNSDSQGFGSTTNTALTSPSFATTNFTNATISFWHYFRQSGTAKVQYSIDGGTSWVDIQTYTTNTGAIGAFVQANLPLPVAALNQADVRIRFKYDAAWQYFWAIDNVVVSGNQSNPITWSPITNLFTDAAATVPYVANANASTVYVKSSSAGTTTYTVNATNSTTGCNISATVDVTVTANSTLPTEVISACDSYTWAANGTTYTTSGIYTNVVNCVTRTLDLTITPSSSLPNEVVSACDSYTWAANGTIYTTSGTYTNVINCVTRTLNLTITPSSTLPTEVISACDSYTWAANGTTYTTSGVYTSTVNCVTRNLDLTITPSSSLPNEVVSVCDTYTWAVNGTTYTTSGIYTSTTSCVTRTLDLTITPSSSLPTEVVSVCDTYTWAANGTTYTTSGIYTSTTSCVTRTLDLTITSATISGATTQVINGGVAADATIEDIIVTSNGTVTWFASSADATANVNPLAVGTQLVDGNIYYGVTNIGTCRSTTLAVTVTVVLGTSSFDLSQLNYYPNPVKDIFNVKYSKEIISVDVYDLTGRKVIEMKPNTLEVQLNMTNLSNAMYIVRLQSVDGMTELKVYKN